MLHTSAVCSTLIALFCFSLPSFSEHLCCLEVIGQESAWLIYSISAGRDRLSSELPAKDISTSDTLAICRMEMCFHDEFVY